MWSVNRPPDGLWGGGRIVPSNILYSYDHHLTFIALIGFDQQLFHNIGQRGDRLFYIVVPIQQDVIDALCGGALSVYGALNQQFVRIIETNLSLDAERYWGVAFEDVPTHLLPEQGVALYATHGRCPDTIEQATGFFSMRFMGSELKRSGAPFSLVKNVIDHGYSAARSLLSPSFLQGARSETFDFNVTLVSSSLLLKLNLPTLNPVKLRKRSNVSVDVARSAFSQKRDDALEILDELNKSVGRASVRSLVTRHISVMDDIVRMIPTEDGRVSAVEFSGESSSFGVINIGRRAGAEIGGIYQSISEELVEDEGVVKIINDPSKYFVYESNRGKQVACRIPHDVFDRLNEAELFGRNAIVKVRGRLTRRKNRDEIWSEDEPELLGWAENV